MNIGVGCPRRNACVGALERQHLPDLVEHGAFMVPLLTFRSSGFRHRAGVPTCFVSVSAGCCLALLFTSLAVVAEIRNHAGLDEDSVGFVQQHAKVGNNVTIKLLEQNQAFAYLDFQRLDGFHKGAAEMFWRHGVNRRFVTGARINHAEACLQL